MDCRVRSITKGFLELVTEDYTGSHPLTASSVSPFAGRGAKSCRLFHRTARDFVLDRPKLGQIVDSNLTSISESIHRLRLAEILSLDLPDRQKLCVRVERWSGDAFNEELSLSFQRYQTVFGHVAKNAGCYRKRPVPRFWISSWLWWKPTQLIFSLLCCGEKSAVSTSWARQPRVATCSPWHLI
ncbi:uncharacterized protein BDV17DRAFT_222482 [Aspergillus undulatus]|uniref:uncharacterized protein n=1 Tax=Aspergillus undulatus TaxID=1810928 RepID=UPI003CCDCF5E